MSNGRSRAAVIGSGFGGLAAAIRLQAAGVATTVFEARDKPGGRAYVYEDQGFVFDGGLSDSERAYLGLQESGPFSISQIQADLVLVEFLNVYCYACVQQAPIMNEVYSIIMSR